jgi:tRNA (adenine57-N1/adenine58-N1)-methyltransferase
MKTLRPDTITKICCFSPCLEQVLKTVAALRAEGFSGEAEHLFVSRASD